MFEEQTQKISTIVGKHSRGITAMEWINGNFLVCISEDKVVLWILVHFKVYSL
jgi:hypothetical protein